MILPTALLKSHVAAVSQGILRGVKAFAVGGGGVGGGRNNSPSSES